MANIVFSPALQAPIALSNPTGAAGFSSDPVSIATQHNPIPLQGSVSLISAAVKLALAMATNQGALSFGATQPTVISGVVTKRVPTVGALSVAGAAPTVAVASTQVLTFPRLMQCAVGGDQGYGRSNGYPWTTAAAGTAANNAIQNIAAYDISVLNGSTEGWDSNGTYDRENLTQACLKKQTTYSVKLSQTRPCTLFFYQMMMSLATTNSPYQQYLNLVQANNWWLYQSPGGTGTITPAGGGQNLVNYSAAWPGAIGSAGIGASICGANYGTNSSGSPTGVQGPARSMGNYVALKYLIRNNGGIDSRFTFNSKNASPSCGGVFMDNVFVALDGQGNVPNSSLDGITIAPGSQVGAWPSFDTVQPVMARGNRNMFDQMQAMAATYQPGSTFYNFANFGQYANVYQFHKADLVGAGLDNLHGGLLENAIGAGLSSWETFQQGNPNTGNTSYPSGWPSLLANYYAGMDFCLAPKLVGLGTKLPSTDGSKTASWPVGAGTTLTTVTTGSALEYQLMRYGLCTTLLDDGYFAPGVSGYDWSTLRWYDEYGDDSLTQVNVKRGYLGTPLTTRPTTPTWNQGTLGVWGRAFTNGYSVVNPRGNGAQTITLPRQYQALTGTQQPSVNNGAVVSSLTIPDGDGRIFILPTGQAWTFSDLVTGWIGQNNSSAGLQRIDDGSTGNTCVWTTDSSGSFLRYTAVKAGTCGLRHTVTTTGLHEICVQYDIRRSSNNCSKQCKTYGWGQANGGNSSNATFGCTMGGYAGTSYGVYYGDFASGGNDATVAYATSGYPTSKLPAIGFGDSFSRTPYPTQATTVAAAQDTTGTVWETWMVYFRASSPSTPDGQITIWKMINGAWTMVMNQTNLWNCSSTTQDRGGFAMYEYSSNSGFHEDYRNVYQMFAKPVGMGI